MKYEEIIKSLENQYVEATIRMKKEIMNILEENGGKIDIGDEDCETPVLTMWDGNGSNDDVTVKSIELVDDNTIYVNGISDWRENNVSYEAFSEHYFWLLEFVQIWDKTNN